jgi:site-specific DNA recombinase
MYREYASTRGWEIIAELAEDDRGASGVSFDLPQLTQVLEMALAGKYDTLVVREIDRLSRSLAKQLIIEEELKRYGVQIEYVLGEYPNTPEGQLNKNIKAVIAEYERLKINERMVRGRRQKVKAGSVLVHGRPPYGYKSVESNGKHSLVIHEPEARIVRMIFDWYTQGDNNSGPLTINDITRKLSKMKIPTPSESKKIDVRKRRGWGNWSLSTVNNILKTETYSGVWHYGKWGIDPQTGGSRRNPKSHLLSVEVPAIISQEVWNLAQARIVKNRKNSRRSTKYNYLMSKRVTCGNCGIKRAGRVNQSKGKRYQYYICKASSHRLDYATKCNAPLFRADQVDDVVWKWVKSLLMDPDYLEQGLTSYNEEKIQENTPVRERLKVVDDLLAENQAQLNRLLDLYLHGDFPMEILVDHKERIRKTIESLEEERAKLAAGFELEFISDRQIQSIKDFAREVAQGLSVADDDFQTKREVIETLDVQATLVVENDEKVVYASCVLNGARLPLDHTNTNTSPAENRALSSCPR